MLRFRSILSLIIILIAGNSSMSQNNTLKIAFSKIGGEAKYKLYPQWLTALDSNIDPIDMSGIKAAEAGKLLESCSGLVLTGGPDIFPGLYRKDKDLTRCEKVDRVRDSEEIMLIKKALEMKIPIFAICRGAQLMNVYHGGSLIVDVSMDYGSLVPHRLSTPKGAEHPVTIEPKTYFAELLKVKEGVVNSFHHQAVEKLAPVFVAQAKSPDGIIEAYTWKEPAGKSFLIAVQWHPERMNDNIPFSKTLAEEFLSQARNFRK